MSFTAKIDGDPDGGWIGEIHDGQVHTVHHPVGDTLRLALSHMLHMHFGDNPAASPGYALAEEGLDEDLHKTAFPVIKDDPATVDGVIRHETGPRTG